MKKRLFALCLTLALCLGLLVIPAAAAPSISAFQAVELLDNYDLPSRGGDARFPFHGKFFVDFNQDGIPEMVTIYYSSRDWHGILLVYYITNDGFVSLATGYSGGVGGDETGINFGYGAGPSGTAKIVHFQNGTYGLKSSLSSLHGSSGTETFQYQGNGKFKTTRSKGTEFFSFEGGSSQKMPDKYAFFPKPAEPWSPPVPNVPAAPLGSGLTPAPADAIAALKDISYYGDRSAITMTQEQAGALLNQISWYSSITTNANYPGAGPANTYAALFDAGAGVPGLFMAKGYCMAGGSPYVSGARVITDFGESALWTFQKGKLTLFSPATYGTNYTLYPACVEQDNGAPDGSYTELRYFPVNYGSLSNTPATTVITTETTASVNGYSVSQSKANEHMKAWRGTGARAYASQGGGVEYVINGMTPAADVTAALKNFVAALTPAPAPVNLAYPSTQIVSVDGKAVEFQCYALKDTAGNDVNYVKLRDLASILNDSAARFEVAWDGAVSIETGRPYTPNGSEMSTPFSGQREYQAVTAKTLVNGDAKELAAFTLTDDHGGAYTYYKLRDLGAAIGFKVDWSAERGIFIETE